MKKTKIAFFLPLLFLNTSLSFGSENHPKAPPPKPHQDAKASDKQASHNNHHAEASTSIDGDTAFRWLQNGNNRYVNRFYRNDGKGLSERKNLVKGQKPHSIILSCSDSRVPPELIFDQGLGEIFVIRVAGEALDTSVIASMEYAVEHLGSKLVLVLGHHSCGAVRAALETPKGKSAGSASLDSLVADIKPRLTSENRTPASQSPGLIAEVSINARGVAKDLIQRSEIIKHKYDSGELKIKSGVYSLETGKVEFFND
jgi:carbonic anhydrase